MVEAMAAIMSLEEVRVFSPTRSHCESFVQRMTEGLGLQVVPCASAEEVASCTDSNEPTISADWLRPGMHVSTVTSWEAEPRCWDRVDRWVRYPSESTQHHYTAAPNLRPAVTGGFTDRVFKWAEKLPAPRQLTLERVIAGIEPGRESDEEITLYFSEGSGVQFAVAASLIYAEAKSRGLGRELPVEWFLESIRD